MAAAVLHPLTLLAVMCGAAAGGLLRHAVTRLAMRRFGDSMPWGTLAVNLSGALLAGLFGGLWYQGDWGQGDWGQAGLASALFLVGLLGSYTTVSALSLQALELAQGGWTGRAVRYLLLTLGLGLPATAVGLALAGWLAG